MAGKSKKLKIKKLQINLTNRWLYTLIVFFSLIVIGVFVYAVAPNPGHDITQIEQPSGCSADQFLKWTGSSWTCDAVIAQPSGCSADQFLKWTGSSWTCETITTNGGAETDPIWTGASTNVAFINKANAFGAFTQSFDTNVLFVDATNNMVGIGTRSPSAPLHTKGAGATSSTNSCEGSPHGCYAHNGDGSGCDAADCMYSYSTGVCSGVHSPCSFYGSSTCASHGCTWKTVIKYTSKAAIFEAGNVGIGDTAPVYALELPNLADYRGRGRANQWAIYSSIRWKENIIPIDSALDKIIQLQGVYFDWKPEYGGSHGIGLIAEDVGKIIPEVVDWEDDGIYARSLDYDHLTALLIEAIKEQQQEIENLKQEIETLKTI